jgi:hypothetical protein
MCSNPPEFDSHGMWVLIFSSLNELVVDSSVGSSSVNKQSILSFVGKRNIHSTTQVQIS